MVRRILSLFTYLFLLINATICTAAYSLLNNFVDVVMGAVLSKARSNVDFDNAKLWWSATAFYCAYVVLGGFSPAAHEHAFTRDPKSLSSKRC